MSSTKVQTDQSPLSAVESSLGLAFIGEVGNIVSANPEFFKLLQAATSELSAESDTDHLSGNFSHVVSDLRHRPTEPVLNPAAHIGPSWLDTLTRLGNEKLLVQAVDAWNTHPSEASALTVIMIGLKGGVDALSSLSDIVSDQLQVSLAERISKTARHEDLVIRLETGTFLLLQRSDGNSDYAQGVADRLLDTLNHPVLIQGQELNIQASAGVCIMHDHSLTSEQLLEQASAALVSAEASGIISTHCFNACVDIDLGIPLKVANGY